MNGLSISVSDIAIAQRCPFLLAHKIHLDKKSAWRVGKKSNGAFYGSIFHQHIAKTFFKAASNPKSPLHKKLLTAVEGGWESLSKFILTEIFFPFSKKESKNFKAEQILSIAQASDKLARAVDNFLERNSAVHFALPEGKLQDHYVHQTKNKFEKFQLLISGRYDAFIFNPAKNEARLFEFKGLKKTDLSVPLSQSLIYAWLIWKDTKILPSIEVIYLEEENFSNIFAPGIVKDLIINTLPDLFKAVYDVLTCRRRPMFLKDEELCSVCKFSKTCERNMEELFLT